jgi:shikimate dehydrogenase
MRKFGLIGFPLSHSFSKQYFSEKFHLEGITDASYELFPLETIEEFPALLENEPGLLGLNVTVPYKEKIIRYLSEIDPATRSIGAVNVLKKLKNGQWKGYNSDYYGFLKSLLSLADRDFWSGKTALIFGTGGSSKAVAAALEFLGVDFVKVSRSDRFHFLTYQSLTSELIAGSTLLVNCTPLGMYPAGDDILPIPYEGIGPDHFCIDLIYNPSKTVFLELAEANGARIMNGLPMLHWQAEKAWEIWNED